MERYSLLLTKEAFQLQQEADGVFVRHNGKRRFPGNANGISVSIPCACQSFAAHSPACRTWLFRSVFYPFIPLLRCYNAHSIQLRSTPAALHQKKIIKNCESQVRQAPGAIHTSGKESWPMNQIRATPLFEGCYGR